jgi:nucleotide-binding universal stress UspA family protein
MAASLARARDAKLHLITVVRPPEGWWGIVGSPPTPTALSKTLTDAQREILDTAIAEIDLSDVEYDTVEEVGDPARMLIEYCQSVSADLLVVGKRGAGLLERIVLGSVANRVANDAPCPVLLVP